MIKKSCEFEKEVRVNMKGGPGSVEMYNFVSKEDMNNKGRLFGTITLNKDCGIGYHIHEGESEIFYIIQGNPIYNHNGEEVQVNQGDVLICESGTGHGIRNEQEEPVILAAVIVYA